MPVLPQDPSQAPLKERSLEPALRQQLQAQAALGGADAARALYLLGLDDASQGHWAEAGARWQQVVKEHAGSGWDRLAQFKTAVALEQTGDLPRAFVQYQGLLTGTAVVDLPERAHLACQRLVESLPPEGLRQLVASPWPNDEFRAPMMLRLVESDMAQGLTESARSGLEAYILRYPNGPDQDKAEALSRRLDASVAVNARSIGLLIPLKGPLAPYGQQVRQGVELALDQSNLGRAPADQFVLHVADEGATAATTIESAKALIDRDQALAMLGPLSSDAVQALVPLLASRRVPLFSPSASRADLDGVSPWFFRNTLTPVKQAMAMADYAVAARRLTRVAILAPDSPYGGALSQAFAARVTELGGAVALSITYSPGTRDFKDIVLALGGVDPSEGKDADSEEKRDQQAKVEESSTGLGRFLLGAAKDLSVPAGVTETPKLRVLVVDFNEDTASAELNAGRAFSDRFYRTLGQLPELDVLGPAAAVSWFNAQQLSPSALSLPQVMAVGQALSVNFVLGGTISEIDPVKPKNGRSDRQFLLTAQVIDAQGGTIEATRHFTWTKYRPPAANPSGLQALYMPASAEDVGRLLPSLIFCELPLPLLGSDQWDRPELQRHLGDLNGAVFAAAYWPDSPDEAVQHFDQAYRDAYAARPGLLSAQAFDAANLVLQKIRGGAQDRLALRNALLHVSGWDGVSGRTSFEGRQDAVKRPALIGIQDGAMTLIKEP